MEKYTKDDMRYYMLLENHLQSKYQCKRQILRSLPNYAPLFIGGAYCNIQPEVLSTMA